MTITESTAGAATTTDPGTDPKRDLEAELLAWVRRANPAAVGVDARTPLFTARVLTSLQLTELLLTIERLRGEPIEADELSPQSFRSVEAICSTFFDRCHPIPSPAP